VVRSPSVFQILDANRQAMQRAKFITAHHRRFGFLRSRTGTVLIQGHHGIHRVVHLTNALQAAFQQFNWGKLAPPNQAARFKCG